MVFWETWMYRTVQHLYSEANGRKINLWNTLSSKEFYREMKNISRGPTFEGFFIFLTETSMADVTVARLQSKEYGLPSPPSFKCNVLRKSLSVDSQKFLAQH